MHEVESCRNQQAAANSVFERPSSTRTLVITFGDGLSAKRHWYLGSRITVEPGPSALQVVCATPNGHPNSRMGGCGQQSSGFTDDSMSSGTVDPDHLATVVNATYASLRFKPPIGQYTILAGFVLVSPERYHVISLATGSKCLPANKLSRHGESVNDSHAEVLAKRGAVLWFFDEVQRMKNRSSEEPSSWIEKHPSGKYQLRGMVHVHMYISTVPCTLISLTIIMYSTRSGGDASTRLLASSQDPEIAQLKDSIPVEEQPPDKPWRGRNNYHVYGVLRTKPGRADSPTTTSMSCSDKIAAWNILGFQGALASVLFVPLYVDSITIGEVPQGIRDAVIDDCRRAFWGRIQDHEGKWVCASLHQIS